MSPPPGLVWCVPLINHCLSACQKGNRQPDSIRLDSIAETELKSQMENKFMAINLLSLIRAHTRDMTTSSGCSSSSRAITANISGKKRSSRVNHRQHHNSPQFSSWAISDFSTWTTTAHWTLLNAATLLEWTVIYLRRFLGTFLLLLVHCEEFIRKTWNASQGLRISVQIWDGFDANRHGMNCENWVINQSNSNQDLEPIKQRLPILQSIASPFHARPM